MKAHHRLAVALVASSAVLFLQNAAQASQVIYDDSIANNWHDWSFAVNRDFDQMQVVHDGSRAIAVTAAPWGCLSFNSDSGTPSGVTTLSFWVHGGKQGGQTLTVIVNGEDGLKSAINLAPLTPTWTHVSLKLSDLGLGTAPLKSIWIRNSSAANADTYFVDSVELQ